jgi:hypothetical protein
MRSKNTVLIVSCTCLCLLALICLCCVGVYFGYQWMPALGQFPLIPAIEERLDQFIGQVPGAVSLLALS